MVLISFTTSSLPVGEEVEPGHPADEGQVGDPGGRPAHALGDGGSEVRPEARGGAGHALPAHVLVGVAQDLAAFAPARPGDRRGRSMAETCVSGHRRRATWTS